MYLYKGRNRGDFEGGFYPNDKYLVSVEGIGGVLFCVKGLNVLSDIISLFFSN